MRALISFVVSLIVIAFLICLVGWLFVTDFFLFDILLLIGWLAIQGIFWLVIVAVIIWVLKEILG